MELGSANPDIDITLTNSGAVWTLTDHDDTIETYTATIFTLSGDGAWFANSDIDITLTNSGAVWTLTDHDDTIETYTATAPGVTPGSQALLTAIQARNGYTQTLSYSGTQLVSVSDSYNRQLSFTYLNGLLETLQTPDGLTVTYAHNNVSNASQLTGVTYSTVPTASLTYLYENAAFPFTLTGILDEDGNRYATWTYDSAARGLTSQIGAGANLSTIAYNSDGSRTVTNALGAQVNYQYQLLQGMPKVTQISRAATSTTAAATELFTYDANGYLASRTDWNGNSTTYMNDVHGQPTLITEAAGTALARVTEVFYHSTFHVPVLIIAPLVSTSLTYDASGDLLTRMQTGAGGARTWTLTWSNFLLASLKGPRTDVAQLTKYTYDGSGALTAVTNALNQVTQITLHTPGGLPQTIVDPNGVTTQLAYDARQRLQTSTVNAVAGGLTTKYSYDAAGNVLSVTLPDGSALANTYDPAHRLIGVADLFNESISYALDSLGDRTGTMVSDAGNAVTRTHSGTFDALGRLIRDTGGAGQTTQYAYDANGNALNITDPLNRVTGQAFDALNRRTKITDPFSKSTTIAYDALNRPTSVTDPNGGSTTYTYDAFGDILREVSPARGTTTYAYDLAGNLTQKTDARGVVANYTYDALNRMTSVKYPAGSTENVTYVYDQSGHGFGVGRLTSITDAAGTLSRSYDERGNLTAETRTRGSVNLLTSYSYDGASRIAAMTYPSGAIAAYSRDMMGRISGVTMKPAGAGAALPVISGITYRPFGPAAAMTFGNGVAASRNFDLDYRLTNLTDAGVQNLAYAYNAANDVLSITDAVNPGNTQSFAYDALDRLTNASGGYGSIGYTYDANGNRLTQSSQGSATLDGLGAVTSLTYNQAGRLATAQSGTQQALQYTYDAPGHRLVKVGATGTTLFQYDQAGQLLEEANGQGAAITDYIYFGDRPIAALGASGKLAFLHTDRLGTPQVATDTSKSVVWLANYEPFGTINAASSQTATLAQDLRLPGQESEVETGWYHNGFRDYAPSLGRYLESDPFGLGGGPNAFIYANANPVSFIDPRGTNVVLALVGVCLVGYKAYEIENAVFDSAEAGVETTYATQNETNYFNSCTNSSSNATACNASTLTQNQQEVYQAGGKLGAAGVEGPIRLQMVLDLLLRSSRDTLLTGLAQLVKIALEQYRDQL